MPTLTHCANRNMEMFRNYFQTNTMIMAQMQLSQCGLYTSLENKMPFENKLVL